MKETLGWRFQLRYIEIQGEIAENKKTKITKNKCFRPTRAQYRSVFLYGLIIYVSVWDTNYLNQLDK